MIGERNITEIKPFENKLWLSNPTMYWPKLKYIAEAYEINWISAVGVKINEAEKVDCEKVGCRNATAHSAGTVP